MNAEDTNIYKSYEYAAAVLDPNGALTILEDTVGETPEAARSAVERRGDGIVVRRAEPGDKWIAFSRDEYWSVGDTPAARDVIERLNSMNVRRN